MKTVCLALLVSLVFASCNRRNQPQHEVAPGETVSVADTAVPSPQK